MATMFQRFLRISECINHALVEIGLETFSESELVVIKKLYGVLEPLEVAVKELSKDKATLITAEGVYKFLFNNLSEMKNNEFSQKLIFEIKKRMDQRRNKTLITLMIYLQTGIVPKSTEFLNYSTKTAAKILAETIVKNYFMNNNYADTDDDTTNIIINDDDDDLQLIDESENINGNDNDLQKQLHDAISSLTAGSDVTPSDNRLKKDFEYLDAFKKRTEKLEKLYATLLTISPTSTITERVFSTTGNIKTKIRSSLKFKNLNMLLFLKYYFKKEEIT